MPVLTSTTEPILRSDRALIQGVWVSVAGPRRARLLFAGNRFTFEFVDGDIYMGTFDLAYGHMDMHIEAGPPRHVGTHSRCLYQIDGDELRWCSGKPGSDRRPTEFPPVDDPRHMSLVFRRTGPIRR